jgi:hypothetical protein
LNGDVTFAIDLNDITGVIPAFFRGLYHAFVVIA